MDKSSLIDLVGEFAGKRILVIGDVFLDQYVVGRATRLSREAPVPILEFDRQFSLPGAAANPANNIQTLGGQAIIVGVVGDDEPGIVLKEQLRATGIDVSGIIVDPSRPTTTKTRVVAEDGTRIRQQIVRIDRLDRREMDGNVLKQLLSYIERTIETVHAVLVSDYKSGLVCKQLVDVCLEMARRSGKLLTADSQGDLQKFAGYALVKCNQAEAEARFHEPLAGETSLEAAANLLLKDLRVGAVVITRGGDGMSVADATGYAHIPVANRSEVFDVTGAGDTVIAVLTLALAAEGSLLEAAHLSNFAAGLVVRRLGNATTSPEELRQAIKSFPVA
ncbi:MAG: bifunctional ADP-heptose synthase [Dehalococcoidales bacterium]|nr:bifunctional ADP-heptose synthase [Dehalococcoidales bacterium]